MNRIASRAVIVTLLVLFLVAGLSFFAVEYAARAEAWVLFPGSPRVYNGGNIGCGTVVDRENTLLLDMRENRTYSTDSHLRKATVHWIGDRKGSVSAPALTHYASEMVGFDRINGVYRYGNQSATAKLTLSADVQTAALKAMGDLKGTAAVYNYKTGELLCAVTTPTFDPDNIPNIEGDTSGKYDGIYVNRFTKSVYIPGSIFKTVTLAAALETIPDIREQTFTCSGKYQIGTEYVTCEQHHGKQDVQTAFRNSCNCAFARIVEQLGAETLKTYVDRLGVVKSLEFDGITTAPGHFDLEGAAPISVAWSGIGQYTDQINPCAFMTFMGAIAGGGQGAKPHLVEEIRLGKETTYQAKTQMGERILSEETAETLREFLRSNVEMNYGSKNFPGLTVCGKTGTAQVGGEKRSNAMFTGFVADDEYPLAFIICIEDYGYGKTAIPVISKILTACKTAVN